MKEFRVRPRFALNCSMWQQGGGKRYGPLARERMAQRRRDDRDRAIAAYAREHHVSAAAAERELFGED